MRLLALIFGDGVYGPFSWLIRSVLRVRGIRVGTKFHVEAVPILKIRGRARDIVIGNSVRFVGRVDLRNREQGKIVISDRVKVDHGTRLVAANQATLYIGADTNIGCFNVFNCGDDVTIGEKCLTSGFVYIQSSNHGIERGAPIKDQPQTYGAITIGDDVWLASHVSVLAGVRVGTGAVVGSKAVLTKDVSEHAIVAGVPAAPVGERRVTRMPGS